MAISNLESTTGISLMEMVKELDTGKVYWQKPIAISLTDTFDSLQEKFFQSFDMQFLMAMQNIFDNNLPGIEQVELIKNGAQLSYAPIITKSMCLIDWSKSAKMINAQVRSLFSKPLARTRYGQIVLKIFRCSIEKNEQPEIDQYSEYLPGEIIWIDQAGILVNTKCGTECLLIEQIQLPNKNPVKISLLINGKHIFKKHWKFFSKKNLNSTSSS